MRDRRGETGEPESEARADGRALGALAVAGGGSLPARGAATVEGVVTVRGIHVIRALYQRHYDEHGLALMIRWACELWPERCGV